MRRLIMIIAGVVVFGAGTGLGYVMHSPSSPGASTGTHQCEVYVGAQPEFPDGYALRDLPDNVPCP